MSQPESQVPSDFEVVEVLVDCPGVQGLYTYRFPKNHTVEPGDIVSVPFGGRQLGAIAILVGTINISGGFLVTQRMLKMFRK